MSDEIEKQDNRINNSRPFKMESWLPALKEVFAEQDIIFLTDEDLVFLVNDKLPVSDQISKSCFEKWKAGKFPDGTDELGKEFIKSIKYALIKQKLFLGNKLKNDKTGQWTRYAWILERKFTEWNLKHISENINKNEQATVIQITANSDEQKALIDKIIYSDFEEIKPTQIENNVKEDDYEF